MAAFMIAHLQDGRYGEARILEEATAQEMHARQFAGDPRLDGVAYGFEEQTLNGERAIVHGGDQLQYHALAALLPERNVGIFVAYNSTGNGGDYAEYELVEAFIDRFYPEPGSSATETRGNVASGNAERVAGSYRPTLSNLTGFEKFMTLPNSSNVTANEDGSITTSGVPSRKDLDGGEQRWVEVAPLLFQAEGGDEHITFRQDSEGNVQYLFGEASPRMSSTRSCPPMSRPGFTSACWPGASPSSCSRPWRGRLGRRSPCCSGDGEGSGTGSPATPIRRPERRAGRGSWPGPPRS
jgi:Beta-lactamase